MFTTAVAIIVFSLCQIAFAEQKEEPLKVGEKAPNFELIDADGKQEKLETRFGAKGHPVILLFSRAHW